MFLAESIMARIGNDPNRLAELSDGELQVVEAAQHQAGCILATRLYQRVNRDHGRAEKLLQRALVMPSHKVARRAQKAKQAVSDGRKPSPSDLAALLVWGRAEHDHIETEFARREAKGETIQ